MLEHSQAQFDLRVFLDLCNVYHHFDEGYARIAYQLNELLKKGHLVKLDPSKNKQARLFDSLIDAVLNSADPHHPRNGLSLTVDTNTSSYNIRVSPFQTFPVGEQKR